jgi:hypothetical protein
MMTAPRRTRIGLLPVGFLATVSLLLPTGGLHAALIAQYDLFDHPDGNQNPPPYGLRLDGLSSVPGPGSLPGGEYLFSAELNGSHLTLDVLEDDVTGDLSLHIYGTMYGGLQDDGAADHLDALLRGSAQVDFTYRQNVVTGPVGALYTVTGHARDLETGNTGTLLWTDGSGTEHTFYLQDQSGGFSARLAYGHRVGPGVLAFWGWVNHSTFPSSDSYRHVYSSDWLLTAAPVHMPEPATVLSLGIGLAAAGLARRRRRAFRARS